jgi:DNA-binding MarR family transcriptional regulator
MSDKSIMPFDNLIANAGRLRILTALAVENRQEFVRLRQITRLSDGNLSAHARRLCSAGLVEMEKRFRDGRPVTTFHLTDDGRRRLTEHVRGLLAAVEGAKESEPVGQKVQPAREVDDEDWVD